MADHGVISKSERQGPMPNGDAGYLQRELEMSPAVVKGPMTTNDPFGRASAEISQVDQDRAVVRHANFNATGGMEAQVNQNRVHQALDQSWNMDIQRKAAGQGVTREGADRYKMMLLSQKEMEKNRGFTASENDKNRTSAKDIAAISALKAGGEQQAPQTVDLGDGRKAAYLNGQMQLFGGGQAGSSVPQPDGSYRLTQPNGEVSIVWPNSGGTTDPMAGMAENNIKMRQLEILKELYGLEANPGEGLLRTKGGDQKRINRLQAELDAMNEVYGTGTFGRPTETERMADALADLDANTISESAALDGLTPTRTASDQYQYAFDLMKDKAAAANAQKVSDADLPVLIPDEAAVKPKGFRYRGVDGIVYTAN